MSEATELYVRLESDKNKIIKETSAGLNSVLLESQQRDTTIFQLKSEIADWKAKFGYSEDRFTNVKQELSEMGSNFDLMRIESQDKDRLFSDMQTNLNSNLKKISEKEKVIQTLESDIKTLSSQLDAALLELETLKSICETQKTKIVKLESELSQVKEKLVGTEDRYSDAERRFTESTQHDHSNLENMKRDFEATEATLREKLATIAELETSLAALTAENSCLVQQNATHSRALEDLRVRSVLLDVGLEQRDDRISELTGRLQSFESLEKEKSQLEGKLSEATKLYVGLETDKNKIIKETSAGLNSALLESQQSDTTIFQLKSEIGDWKAKFGYSEDRSRNLK